MDTTKTIESENGNELKYLGFVWIAAIKVLICVTNLYEYAKQNSGPLRSGVGTVESIVASVIGPVCEKFKHTPRVLLVFLDNKVDEVSNKFDEHIPPVAKQVYNQIWDMVHKASQLTQKPVSEASRNYVATRYKQFILDQTVKAWVTLNGVPPIHRAAEMAVPVTAHWLKKYNNVITDMTQKGYSIFSYFPLVPVEKIAKAFKQGMAEKEDTDLSSSDEEPVAVHETSDNVNG